MAYDINYDDKRFTEVEADKKEALSEVEKTYGDMIGQSDKYYQSQIDAAKDYAETQKKNQQDQTDFAIEQIEQQKDQAKKDYTKEQAGAYVDWQKTSDPYGVNAEKVAAQGLTTSGYADSLQTQRYVAYQNRVATARETFSRAVLNYDNAIKDARLQNNSALAEIAYNALKQQLELSLQGFQYKNQLLIEQANKKREVENTYYSRYQDVLEQINKEKAFEEQKRQFDTTNELQKAQLALQREQFEWQKEKTGTTKTGAAVGAVKKSQSSNAAVAKKVASRPKKTSAKTYEGAAKALQRAGATTGDGGLMTKSEWLRRKNSGSNRAETSYATYEDYLQSFTAWRLQNPEK